MLGAIAGAEALEIVVLLKDLSEAGLRKLESNVKSAEHTANTRNFSGWSKATKGVGEDAERAAGAGGKGGVGALLGGFLGLPGPVAIAGVAIAGFAALTAATLPVYEKVEQQEKAINIALKAHGDSLDAERDALDKAIATGEKYGMGADDTRGAVLQLVEAGIKFSDIEASLPAILSLAIAKHISAAEAADLMAKSTVGNVKGLADLGIKLPAITGGLAGQAKATKEVDKASRDLHGAQRHLSDVEHELAGKTHLTTAEQIRLRDAHDKVKTAAGHLKTAHDHLAAATDIARSKGDNFKKTSDAILGSTGDQAGSVSALTVKEKTLGDKWEHFTTIVGPALKAMLGAVLDVLSGIVDALGNAIDWISKIRVQGSSEASQILAKTGGINDYGKGHHAAGGWVGLHGPEIALLGERGPEFVVPNHALAGGGMGGTHVTVNVGFISMPTTGQIRQLADTIGRELRRDLARAAPTSVRT